MKPPLTRPRFWLTLITIMGGLLRFAYLLQIEHNTDRAYPVWQALRALDHGIFPLTSLGTSVLFANPPLMGYLLLPVSALTRHPLGAVIFVIALNTLGIVFTYRAARIIASPRAALLAAFLVAVNPWLIEYSRFTWVQGLLPVLVPALAWALWSAVSGTTPHPARRMILAFVLLTIAAQTYLLAFALLLPFGLTLLISLRHLNPATRRAVVIGALIFATAGALYGVGLWGQRDLVGAQIAKFGQNSAHLSTEALSHALRLVTGQDYPSARGLDAPIADGELRQAGNEVAHGVLLAALIIGTVAALWGAAHGQRRALLPVVWFAIPILLMSYVGQIVHPFYQLLGIPAGALLAGMGIEGVLLVRASAPVARWRWGVFGLLALPFAGLMALNSFRYAQETAHHPGAHGLTALSLEYGLPLGAALQERLPADGTVFSAVEVWIPASFAGGSFGAVSPLRLPSVQVVPARGGVIVIATAPDETMPPIAFTRDAWRAQLPDGAALLVARVGAAYGTMPTTPCDPARHSTAWLDAVACTLTQSADGWELTSYWRVLDELPPDVGVTNFAPFVHVFDESGARIAIIDGQAIPGTEWRPGDVHIHQMTIPKITDGGVPVTIGLGQYDGLRGENILFVDDAGATSTLFLVPLPQ